MAKTYRTTEQSLSIARALLSLFEETSLNQETAVHCIQLHRTYKIKLPDAIIAATALVKQNNR